MPGEADGGVEPEIGCTIGIAVVSLVGVTLLYGLFMFLLVWSEEPQKAGSFGDMFGAVNALFSGLALAFVAVAVWLQSRQLAAQKEELSATRKELREAKLAQQGIKELQQQQLRALQVAGDPRLVARLTTELDIRLSVAGGLPFIPIDATIADGQEFVFGATTGEGLTTTVIRTASMLKLDRNVVSELPSEAYPIEVRFQNQNGHLRAASIPRLDLEKPVRLTTGDPSSFD